MLPITDCLTLSRRLSQSLTYCFSPPPPRTFSLSHTWSLSLSHRPSHSLSLSVTRCLSVTRSCLSVTHCFSPSLGIPHTHCLPCAELDNCGVQSTSESVKFGVGQVKSTVSQVDECGVSRQVAVRARVNNRCGMHNACARMRVRRPGSR